MIYCFQQQASTWKTQTENLKAANGRLVSDVEVLMDRLDELTVTKNTVENTMENLVVRHLLRRVSVRWV